MISELGNRILDYLRHQNGPVSGKNISMHCHVSLHTIANEITLLNEDLFEQGLQIRSHISKGYSLDVIDEERANAFAIVSFRKAKRFSYLDVDKNAKAYFIIRFLLCSEKIITTDYLAEIMYVSKSTILREMPRIQEYLSHYNLQVLTKRGLGIHIKGSEWNKRICLLNLEKAYNILSPEEKEKETCFNRAILKDQDPGLAVQLRSILIHVLSDHPSFQLSALYTPRIIYYILFAASRQIYEDELIFTDEQLQLAGNSLCRNIAEDLLDHLPARLKRINREKEITALTALLDTYGSFTAADLKTYTVEAQEALAWISKRYDITYLIDAKLITELAMYLYSLHRSCIYQLSYDAEAIVPAVTEGLFAAHLCVEFARYFMDKYDVVLDETQIYNCYYTINRNRFMNNTPVRKFRFMVTSIYGSACAEDLAERIKAYYSKYIAAIDTGIYADTSMLSTDNYDVLITDSSNIPAAVNKLKIISFDYLRNRSNETAMQQFIREESCREALSYFPRNHLATCNLKKKEDVLELIYRTCHPEMDKDAFIDDLKKRNALVTVEKQNQTAMIVPYSLSFDQPLFYVFINQKPIIWDKEETRFFIYCDYGKGDRKSVEALNSLQKSFLECQFSALSRLDGTDYDLTIETLFGISQN